MVDAVIDHYVAGKEHGSKMISNIIHDIWRFGEQDGLHFLFEARLLTRSVWDLISKSLITPTGETEVFNPRITRLVAGATSFREMVAHRIDVNQAMSANET